MSAPDQVAAFQAAESLLGSRFRLERLIVANRERVLFLGVDQILKRTTEPACLTIPTSLVVRESCRAIDPKR